jgi:hypothetical protein
MPNPQVAAPGTSIGHSELQGAPDREPHGVVPTVHNWQAVGNHAVATAEGGSGWFDQTNPCAIVGWGQ